MRMKMAATFNVWVVNNDNRDIIITDDDTKQT